MTRTSKIELFCMQASGAFAGLATGWSLIMVHDPDFTPTVGQLAAVAVGMFAVGFIAMVLRHISDSTSRKFMGNQLPPPPA